MRIVLSTLFLFLISHFGFSQNINALEYFIDIDPGVGNATPVPITNGITIDETFTVPTAALPTGFHNLVIRIQDASLQWSLQEQRVFYIITSALSTTATVQTIEYFIDNDPGYGNATPLPITTGTTVDFTGTVSTSALSAGFHTIYVRAFDSDGVWGNSESRTFYVATSDLTSQASIVAMEYFIDDDPGYGGGTSIPISAGTTIDFNGVLSTSALPSGFHKVYVRGLDSDGTWGESESRTFYVDEFGSAQIAEIEYFIDDDPGYGNGTTVDIDPDVSSMDELVTFATSALAAGNYDIGMRIVDTNGNFGQTELFNFTVCAGATPGFSTTTVCVGTATDFTDLSTNVLAGDTYSWDFEDDAVPDNTTIGDVSFTYPTAGTYTARLSIDRAGCTTDFPMTVNVVGIPTSNAGVDLNVCTDNTVLGATAPLVGEAGLWTVTSGTGAFTTATDNLSPVTGLTPGVNEFLWTVTDGSGTCSTGDLVQVTYLVVTTPDAGPDINICTDNTIFNASSLAVGETGNWTVVSGTGSFADATDPLTTVTGLSQGLNEFSWTVTDGSGICSDMDMVQVTYLTVTSPDAGPDLITCVDTSSFNASSPAVGESGNWTVVSGTGTFTDAADPFTAVSGLSPGINEFQWEFSDATATCMDSDLIQINYILTSVADAGIDQSICSDNTTLSGSALAVGEIGQWTVVSGTATITDPSDPLSTVTNITSNNLDLMWTIRDPSGTCFTSDNMLISSNLPITAAATSGSAPIGEVLVIDVQSIATINSGDVLSTSITTDPTKGTAVVLADGTVQYTPIAGNLGADAIGYEVCNQCGNCSSETITIDIPNNAPQLQNDPITPSAGEIDVMVDLSPLISDLNNNADINSLQILSQPTSGATASIENGVLTIDYTGITFSGTDELTVEICDTSGECASVTLSFVVNVSAAVDPPLIIYNAVTPNGDALHDFFHIENLQFYPGNAVFIYSKIGALVFEMSDYDNVANVFTGVDSSGEELPNGAYYYVIEYGGNVKSGFLELLR